MGVSEMERILYEDDNVRLERDEGMPFRYILYSKHSDNTPHELEIQTNYYKIDARKKMITYWTEYRIGEVFF
jgi:hypothetical protein